MDFVYPAALIGLTSHVTARTLSSLLDELKDDIKGLKNDTKGLRDGLKNDIEGLRVEVKNDIEGLRGEVKDNIKRLRQEDIYSMRKDIASLVERQTALKVIDKTVARNCEEQNSKR